MGQKRRGYRFRDILAEVESVSGKSYEEFFEVQLKSLDALPVEAVLNDSGIELEHYSGEAGQSQRLRFSENLSRRQKTVIEGWASTVEK